MKKWEYMIINCNLVDNVFVPRWIGAKELPGWEKGPNTHEVLNSLGAQGWELVATSLIASKNISANFILTLKRENPV